MKTKFHSLAVANLVRSKIILDESLLSVNKFISRHADKLMLAGGVALVVTGYPCLALAQGADTGPIDQVIQILLNDMIGGSFGALIMVVAGLVAIISASMGAYRASMSALVVAVGAFVLKTFVIAFWPDVDVGD